ncbi:unnamed protein product [Tilletia laevis]|uniref:Response regulatory domain-containing protein n=2 Tax=Tilletia TaxID=13289 RepID=A0A177VDP5_9BASI|nr:hypothetical protein CF336_g1821 [Tilletia laevis]KAE8263236.1 hypothetical protein A4X03_0g1829 [Tilletia caries]KAE8206826.1 hypothetical protein CF335_g1589 [Tilletia laevis]CAD6884186.1 unnamed protein product [Tilletia caries]CAD6919243.1 unnamed protein product [Tilletia caries]
MPPQQQPHHPDHMPPQHRHMHPHPQHPPPTPGDHIHNNYTNVRGGAQHAGPPFDTMITQSSLYGGPTGLHMQHQISPSDHQIYPQQRAPPEGGPHPMPTPPHFHHSHSQVTAGGPYGPGTPGNANMGAAGYFSSAVPGPGPYDQLHPNSAPGPSHPSQGQSQHALMMPPPPGAMPPMHNPNAVLRPASGSGGGGGGSGGVVDQYGYGIGMAGPDHGGGQMSAEAYQMAMGQSAGGNIVLPPIPTKGASDFVKKLFNMLDDELYEPIVSWGPTGETFVVKNMNDFTKHVLPRHFRHSNFASFVRQLNKYDFHKIKHANASDDMDPMANISASGDQIWEFKHPEFVRGREDLLDSVKRKPPTGKKLGKGNGDDRDGSPPLAENPSEMAKEAAEGYSELKGQVATLTAVQEQMDRHIKGLTRQYQGIIGEMLTVQRNMVQQDQFMQNLIQYLMSMDNERSKTPALKLEDGASSSQNTLNSSDGPFLGPQEARQYIGSYADVARASFSQMSEITRRIQSAHQDMQNNRTGTPAASIHDLGHASGSGTDSASGRTTQSGSPRSGSAAVSPENAYTPGAVGQGSGGENGAGNAESTITQRRHGFSTGSTATSPPQRMYLHPPHFNDDGAGEIFNTTGGFGAGPLGNSFEAAGLRVFTVGTLQPREDNPQDDFSHFSAPGGGGGRDGENEDHPRGSNGEPQGGKDAAAGAHRHDRGESPGGSRLGDGGLRVPNLEDLPESMLKLDRRSSIMPSGSGSPRNGSASPLPPGGSPHDSEASIATIPHSPANNGSGGVGSSLLRIRRSTYVPGWAVPPRVLLVDDDAMCRKLSSKFLQVFGCAIDVAVDGVNAVNKMNLEKYDLVLMDIVMPNLDGVSATSLIRQFDPRTPIISMTSNSQPNELLTYMQNGMTDILPKPFTKEGLLNMLEKHLIHLKTVSQMEQIPHQLGLPSLPEGALQSMISSAAGLTPGLVGLMPAHAGPSTGNQLNLTTTSTSGRSGGGGGGGGEGEGEEGDASMNPLATLGFSDSQYIAMLQNFIASGSVTDSSQGEMTSNLAHAVGASLGEGQGGARRPSQVPGMASPVPNARKRRSEKMDPPPPLSALTSSSAFNTDVSEARGGEAEAAASASATAHAGASTILPRASENAGGSRKRQRTIGSG